jgi:hypothetical protein
MTTTHAIQQYDLALAAGVAARPVAALKLGKAKKAP